MILKSLLILVVLSVFGMALYVRLAPSKSAAWHVDPMTAHLPDTPNAFLQKPGEGQYPSLEFDRDAHSLAQIFDALILATPHSRRLAGQPSDLFVTYVVRTPLMRFPDYVSMRFIDLGEGRATYAVFSRSRFGHSDLGVNKKRFMSWVKRLSQ